MDAKTMIRLGLQAVAVVGVVKAVRQAKAERDNLKLADAAVQGLAIATTVAILVREAKRKQAADDTMLPGDR